MTQTKNKSTEPALSAKAFDILRHAITLARNNSIARLQTLRTLLKQAHPGCDDDIESALQFWANHALTNRAAAAA